jgi:hypothetical protein
MCAIAGRFLKACSEDTARGQRDLAALDPRPVSTRPSVDEFEGRPSGLYLQPRDLQFGHVGDRLER